MTDDFTCRLSPPHNRQKYTYTHSTELYKYLNFFYCKCVCYLFMVVEVSVAKHSEYQHQETHDLQQQHTPLFTTFRPAHNHDLYCCSICSIHQLKHVRQMFPKLIQLRLCWLCSPSVLSYSLHQLTLLISVTLYRVCSGSSGPNPEEERVAL